jgi:copper chaperone
MTTRTLTIDGMTCGHCVKAVTMALQDLPGVDVRDVRIGRAVVQTEDSVVTPEQVKTAIDEAGYTLVDSQAAGA